MVKDKFYLPTVYRCELFQEGEWKDQGKQSEYKIKFKDCEITNKVRITVDSDDIKNFWNTET